MSAHEHWQMDASAPELYERYLVPAITSVWATDLLDRVGPRRGESVLDIACGTGVVARLAEQRGHDGRLVGIDLNTAMLAVARAKSATVDWVEGSSTCRSTRTVLTSCSASSGCSSSLIGRWRSEKWCGCSNRVVAPG